MARGIPRAKLEGTNAADLIFSVRVRAEDPTTHEIDDVDISGSDIAISFTIQDRRGSDRVEATLGNMISRPGTDGVFTVLIPAATMSQLEPADYAIGCAIANAAVTCQLFTGLLTVKDGVVGAGVWA